MCQGRSLLSTSIRNRSPPSSQSNASQDKFVTRRGKTLQSRGNRVGRVCRGEFSWDFYEIRLSLIGIARPAMNDMNFPTQSKVQLGKILLAEDDNDMRRFLGKALQNAGYGVASFDNGLSAYKRLCEEPFELLLTDIVMPEMDGIELARRATELDPEIKVMFITGFAAVALNPDNNAPPQAKVLSKPFHLKDLVNEVQRLLTA
jgi:two-component system cell cycle response regulator CpdR